MAGEQAKLNFLGLVPEWVEDQDLFRHALDLEEKFKEQARREEEERRQQAVFEGLRKKLNEIMLKHISELSTPLLVKDMEAEAQRYLRELEVRAGVPEAQQVFSQLTIKQDEFDPSSLSVTVPRTASYIVLEFDIDEKEVAAVGRS